MSLPLKSVFSSRHELVPMKKNRYRRLVIKKKVLIVVHKNDAYCMNMQQTPQICSLVSHYFGILCHFEMGEKYALTNLKCISRLFIFRGILLVRHFVYCQELFFCGDTLRGGIFLQRDFARGFSCGEIFGWRDFTAQLTIIGDI